MKTDLYQICFQKFYGPGKTVFTKNSESIGNHKDGTDQAKISKINIFSGRDMSDNTVLQWLQAEVQ